MQVFGPNSSNSSTKKNYSALSATKKSDDAVIVPGIGDEGCMLESPSGINTLSEPAQAAVVLGYFVVLFCGTLGLINAVDWLSSQFSIVAQWQSSFALLGVIYMIAGVTHFTVKDEYINIMPKQGAWGIWYLPGSKEFHVLWTGVVEFILGSSLLAGYVTNSILDLSLLPQDTVAYSAFGLLLLTIGVTPANIYMYTHGAKLPMDGPDIGVSFHYIRGFFQMVLCMQFYEMAKPILL